MKFIRTISLVAVLGISVLSLFSCDLLEAIFGGGTTLELSNHTGRPIMKIRWNGSELGIEDGVWSIHDGEDVMGLQPGDECVCDVYEVEDHIRFFYSDDTEFVEYRTANMIYVEEGGEFFFELRNDNVVLN